MQKQGLLKISISQDDNGDASDSSDEERKRVLRSPRGKRSRINSTKSDKLRDKPSANSTYQQKLEWEVIQLLNSQIRNGGGGSTSPIKAIPKEPI